MCVHVSLIVMLEGAMSDYISLLATTDGPLHFYGAPALDSHGDARAGWGFVGGAELEWTGETHDSLAVRFEDKDVARTIKQMVCQKFASRSELIASLSELRGPNGEVAKIPHTTEELASWGNDMSFSLRLPDGYTAALPEGLHVGGYLCLPDGYTAALPEGLHVGGYLYVGQERISIDVYRSEHPVSNPSRERDAR